MFVILTSTLSQLPSDVDDTQSQSLSPPSASDPKERPVLQQGFSSSIFAATPPSSIHPYTGVLDYTRAPRPYPLALHGLCHCAGPRISRSLKDGPPPPGLRIPLPTKGFPKDSANAEPNPMPRSTSSVLQYPNAPPTAPKSFVQPTYYRTHEHDPTTPLLSDTNNSGGRVGRSSKSAPPLGNTETPITPSTALIPTQYQSDVTKVCLINSRNLNVSISNPCSQPPGLPGDSKTLAISSDKSIMVSRSL